MVAEESSRKKLAVIGASYLQMPLVLKAKQLGCEVHCFAWKDGAVCEGVADYFYDISILEHEKILAVCRQIGVDGVTSIASDVAVTAVAYIAHHLDLLGNSLESARLSTDKVLMREALASVGVNVPAFTLISGKDWIAPTVGFSAIVKPTDRSGSRGVTKVETGEPLTSAISTALENSFSGRAVVEQFITGREVSVETISWKGEHYLLAITDKITTGSPHFVELEHHQPALISSQLGKKLFAATRKSLNALGIIYGAGHSEFIITDEGKIFAVEIGARMGGDFIGSDLVKLSTGYDFLAGVVDIALRRFTIPAFNAQQAAGVYFLSSETEHLLPYIRNEVKEDYIVRREMTSFKPGPIQQSSDRSGYLIYQSSERLRL